MGMSRERCIRLARAIAVSGLLSGAAMTVVAQPVHAQSDPPADDGGTTDGGTTDGGTDDGGTDGFGTTDGSGDVGGISFADTGGDSGVFLLGALGLGAAAAARRFARRA